MIRGYTLPPHNHLANPLIRVSGITATLDVNVLSYSYDFGDATGLGRLVSSIQRLENNIILHITYTGDDSPRRKSVHYSTSI